MRYDTLKAAISETAPDVAQIYENMSEHEVANMEKILIGIHKEGWSLDYLVAKLIEEKKRKQV